jgi:hypothetical protein
MKSLIFLLCIALTNISTAQTPSLITKVDYKTIAWPDRDSVITVPLYITLPGRPKAKDTTIFVTRDVCSNPLLPNGLPFPDGKNSPAYYQGMYCPGTFYLPGGGDYPVNAVFKKCYIGSLDLRNAQNITLDSCYVGLMYCLNTQLTPNTPISLKITRPRNTIPLKLATAVKPSITIDREIKQVFSSLWGYVIDPSIFTIK